MDKRLLTYSATHLARLIRNQDVSVFEVVDTHITYANQVNPALNAIVVARFAEARQEARVAQSALKNGETVGPFYGVPFTLKEMIELEGYPCTMGSTYYADELAEEDATVVQRLRAAGAIPIGTTNQPEMAFWCESYNPIYGRTNNPHDVSRTSGGSSGGEGAIIGSGASPFGLGSDVAGSIRIPVRFPSYSVLLSRISRNHHRQTPQPRTLSRSVNSS